MTDYQLTKEVQELASLNFSGNVIPNHWYKAITHENGKPYCVAIILLSDIVYWYRPVIERSESTGEILRIRNKFKADFLQRQTKAFADQFGFTEKQVRDALKFLEDNGYIKRHFRDIDLGLDLGKLTNRQFIEIIPAKIIDLQKIHTYEHRSQYPETPKSTGSNIDVQYTKTTTQTTPKTTDNKSVTEQSSVSKVSFIDKDKKEVCLTDTDIYHRIAKERFECSTSEVEYAMKALSETKAIIYDWWKFIKGTIENYKRKKKSEMICKKSMKRSKNSTSEDYTKEQPKPKLVYPWANQTNSSNGLINPQTSS